MIDCITPKKERDVLKNFILWLLFPFLLYARVDTTETMTCDTVQVVRCKSIVLYSTYKDTSVLMDTDSAVTVTVDTLEADEPKSKKNKKKKE